MFTSNVVSMLNDRNKMTQVSYLTKTGLMNYIAQGKRSDTLGALFNGTKVVKSGAYLLPLYFFTQNL